MALCSQTKGLVNLLSNARWNDREGKVQAKITSIRWTSYGKIRAQRELVNSM